MTNLRWDEDGRGWPNAGASRFIEAGGLNWHVQIMGAGPRLLLLHGTGASAHSWRGLAPLLAERFTVIAPDLPGHGFTQAPPSGGLTLPGMAASLGGLIRALAPGDSAGVALAAGHSAGAAILIRMALDGKIAPRALVSLNGALLPFRGPAAALFPPIAKLLFLNPLAPRLFAWRAGGASAVQNVIDGTGSRLDAEGVALYARLFRSPGHVAGALGMMANWDLAPLARDLPRLKTPLTLVAASGDKAIPADDAFKLRDMLPAAKIELLRGLGHLAHEEAPEQIAEIIFAAAEAAGISAKPRAG